MTLHLSVFFNSPEDQKAIEFLQNSHVQWFLTGSRFFGGFTSDSDWDFFTEYSPELSEKLEEAGFVPVSVYRSFINVSEVFRLGNIHVQLVKGATLKSLIQQKIKEKINMRSLKHHEKKAIWHLAYALVQS